MNLIAYSDSEDSDNEPPQGPPKPVAKPTSKPAFQKVVDRSKPGKIKLQLPTPAQQSEGKDDIESEAPPAKRPRTEGGAFSGFNAMLPAPKRPNVNAISAAKGETSGSKGIGRSLGVGVNLKTGAEPAFRREPRVEDYDENGNPVQKGSGTPLQKEDFRALLNLPPPKAQAKPETKSENAQTGPTAAPDVKPVAKPRFLPLSVARGKKKKPLPARPAPPGSTIEGPSGLPAAERAFAGETVAVEPRPPKPKVSLFSMTADEDTVTSKPSSSGDYQPLLYDAGVEGNDQAQTEISSVSSHYHSMTQSHTSTTISASGAQNLTNIASELNLTEAQRRQLFGRKGQGPDLTSASIIEFNTDQEYAHNEMLRQQGETVQHNALKSISGTGKNSLKSLLNMATTQKDALEDHFAAGRRNKKEAGNKYGW